MYGIPTKFKLGADDETLKTVNKVMQDANASIKELTAAVGKLNTVTVKVDTAIQSATIQQIQDAINTSTQAATSTIAQLDSALNNNLKELNKIADKTVKVDINFTNTEAASRLVKTVGISAAGLGSCALGCGLLYLGIKHALTSSKYNKGTNSSFKDFISHPVTTGTLAATAGAGSFLGGLYLIVNSDSLGIKFKI